MALDDISNTTKISTRMLRALEDEHFDQLPGGVFNKGFVRAYARQVGLDEEEAVSDYLSALRDTQVQTQSVAPDFHAPAGKPGAVAGPDSRHDLRNPDRPGGDRRKHGRRREDRRDKDLSASADFTSAADSPAPRIREAYPAGSPAGDVATRIPWGKLAVALLLVVFALALWNSRRHATPTAGLHSALSSNQSPPSIPVPASTPPSASVDSPHAGRSPARKSLERTIPAGTISAGTTPPSRASITPPATANVAAGTPPSTLDLLIRADKTSWVAITADGKPVAHETLIAPGNASVRASHEIVVRAGNAAGVSFLLNGKEIPAEGNDGEAKTYVFNASGVHVLAQTQPPATAH